MKNTYRVLSVLAFNLMIFTSCQKYLDKKPQMALYVPEKWEDLQALLDNNGLMNFQVGTALIELIADDYYVTSDIWNNSSRAEKDNYVWDRNAEDNQAWSLPYQTSIYYSNVVLDNISKINSTVTTIDKIKNVEGAAFFFRSFAFHYLSQLYCNPYNSNAANEKGIVIKKTAAVEENPFRSSLKDTYQQILDDLKAAADRLPEKVTTTMRPGKVAAWALLARVYLSMSDYPNAEQYADMALGKNQTLLDFNDLVPIDDPLLPEFELNPEIIFFNVPMGTDLTGGFNAKIDSSLYSSYDTNDIRKKAYFLFNTGPDSGTYRFRGSYFSLLTEAIFNGLTTGELYLIKAECLARKGRTEEAREKVNFFLKKRYKAGTFKEYTSSNPEEVLTIVLSERRKEMVFRGQRWTDIRRLNLEGRNIQMRRMLNGIPYSLPPNDLRFALLIPREEITKSGIEQNKR